MAILNRITVGFKQILEVDADPSVTATPAPIGSEAFFDDAGVGKSYLKFGSGDTQWSAYQTGAEPSDWKFTTDANQLNVATAKAYFGTKAGSDFDIEFRRNGEQYLVFTKDAGFSTLSSAVNKLIFTGPWARIQNSSELSLQGGSSTALLQNAQIEINNSNRINLLTNRFNITNPAGTVLENHRAVKTTQSGTYSMLLNSDYPSDARRSKLSIHLKSADGISHSFFEKTVIIDSADNLLLVQDDFTYKNSVFASTTLEVVASPTGASVNFTNLPTNTIIVARYDEIPLY